MLTFCLFLASLAYLSCRLWIRDFATWSVAVGVACSCRQSLGIHTPRVLGLCRGRKCSSIATCDICHDWSLAQWESYHSKRSNAERSKSSNRNSGIPTGPTANPPLYPASESGAASPAPLPPPSPPPLPQRGLG